MRGISLHHGRSHSISAGTTILTVTCAKLGIIIIIKTLWHVLLCADKQQQPFAMKWSYYYSRPWLIIFLAQHITSHPDMAYSPSFWKTFPGVTNVKLYDDTGHYLHKRSTNIQVAVRAVTVEMIRSVLQKDECVKDEPVTGMTVKRIFILLHLLTNRNWELWHWKKISETASPLFTCMRYWKSSFQNISPSRKPDRSSQILAKSPKVK